MPPQRRYPSVPLWLVIAAVCCTLAGCGGNTTLSIESPNTTQTEPEAPKDVPATPEPVADPKDESPPADAMAPAGEKSDPLSVSPTSDVAPKLQPKLTMVDPSSIVGRWRDSFFGTRTLTFNADGTAHMRLDFDFAGRLLYGNRLDFDMTWKLDGGVVTIDIVDGRPASTAKSAMSTWGKRYVYLLDRVEDNKVEMRDGVQATSYTLARLPDSAASTTRE